MTDIEGLANKAVDDSVRRISDAALEYAASVVWFWIIANSDIQMVGVIPDILKKHSDPKAARARLRKKGH